MTGSLTDFSILPLPPPPTEVQCLLKQKYDEDAILNAVRRSLRGEAGLVAMRLELNATVHDIIKKLDSIYWTVDKKEE